MIDLVEGAAAETPVVVTNGDFWHTFPIQLSIKLSVITLSLKLDIVKSTTLLLLLPPQTV